MKLISTTTILAAAASAFAGAAQAQDFSGGYVGAYGSYDAAAAPAIDTAIGAYAGYNYEAAPNVMVGAEVDAGFDWASIWAAGGSVTNGLVNARAGYVVDPSIMLYAKAGGGWTTAAGGSAMWDVGAGGEYAVTDTVTVRGEVERLDPTAAALATQYNLKLGVGYGF